MDREYLRTFQETFHIIRLTPEAGTVLLAALLLAVAALVAGIWFNRRLQSRLKDIPASWIVSPARIRDILQTAIDQRAKVEMLLDGAATRTRFLTSQAVELSDESLRLELSGVVTLSSDWKDRAVEAFLRVRERGEKQPRFYGFTSRLAGMRVDSQGFGLVDVYLPQRLEIRQKRMHLRIEPPSRLVRGLAVWPEDGIPAESPGDWGEPALRHQPREDSGVRLINLSAGGLRFDAPPDSQEHDETAEFKIGDRFYLRLDLESPADNESIRYFLYGRVRNAYEDFASRRKEVGLRFLSQARRPSDNPDSLAWSPIDDEAGVESIDNWVFKRHLEMHRERGSSPDS